MTELKNDRFLRALRREPTDTTPIWVMRQAGRYLPEYRATRGRAGSFMALAQNPELACEVTLQPLERFELDAAILFSDILTIPDAMGLGLTFAQGEGPRFAHPVRTRADIEKLGVPDMDAELRAFKESARAPGADRIYTAGEIEHEKTLRNRASGVPVQVKVWDGLEKLAGELGLPFDLAPHA